MADRLKELLSKILEWWNKFSTKQKTFIISAGAGIILALAVLITLLTRPRYGLLLNCETQKQAAEVTELLEGEGMDYEVSDDAYQIRINKRQEAKASMLLARNDIQSFSYTIDNVTVLFTRTGRDVDRVERGFRCNSHSYIKGRDDAGNCSGNR